ncbi:flagellar motor switch protein FliN [Lacrimispora defluvii]|uniref:Flagellar motor switch protein FliN n=1 Tax=Lacrimispora defluvii TaxID=2719233 RepID=A0ABX1VRX0_9FIRM|nr:flagellar motor switch protein FliN [Lacrimispora defluvii]NNJ31169.1 flagellar motor switch protein FliN [Lacrimispora defluvii]
MDSKNFSAFEIDAIGEILNISLGASATAVSTMLNARVDITTPVVKVLTKSEFEISNLEPAVGVEITYIAGLSGSNIMLLKKHDVKVIVDMLMGTETPEEDFELNELNISAICEVMNQMMGASATALSEFLSKAVNISTPTSFEIEDVGDFKEKYYHDEDLMVVVGFNLKIADQMASEFINVMPPALAKELVAGFFPQGGSEPEEAPVPEPVSQPASAPASSGGILSQEEIEKLLSGSSAPEPQPQEPPKQESSGGILSQEEIEMLLNGSKASEPVPATPTPTPAPVPTPAQTPQPAVSMPAMVSQPAGIDNSAVQQMMNQMQMQQQMINQMQQMILQMQNSQMNAPKKEAPEPKTINVKPVPQNNLTEGPVSYEEQEENRELIMGVPLEVSVEIGRTRKLVKDILEFTKGSLVILDKLAGEQVDLYVNGRCIAKGDVVVVDDNFGIRITKIIKKNVD